MVERCKETLSVHRSREPVETKLHRIAEKACKEHELRFTSLFHLMGKELLRECFEKLRGGAASGIDRVTKKAYAENLEENLEQLLKRLHQMAYRWRNHSRY